jgi:hypothetical protein
MGKWAVLLGDENVWTVDGEPETFSTMQEAMAALDAFIEEEEEEVRRGNLESACDPEDYRIEMVNV